MTQRLRSESEVFSYEPSLLPSTVSNRFSLGYSPALARVPLHIVESGSSGLISERERGRGDNRCDVTWITYYNE